ncbi:MAG: PfkB family carbohydrate kinase, partial [Acidimicrobiia bacterium]|nr:PfkB family carbohydrate kinase [Acidimicrobiia bacterium]
GTDTASRIFRRRGGSAANVAVYAVAAGAAARFVGQVGNDRLGGLLVADLEAAGVDVRVNRAGTTGSIVVLVDQTGERTMLPDRAAAMELDDLPVGALDDVSWLHVPAYSLVVEPLGATSLRAIERAREQGATISIDASSVGPLADYGVARFRTLMANVRPDVFFCNLDEATLLGAGAAAPVRGAALTVVKAGADPVTLVDAAGGTTEVAVPPVAVVSDTTGAGDSFAAGFIAATLDGSSPVGAAEAGCRMAATVLARPGAGS